MINTPTNLFSRELLLFYADLNSPPANLEYHYDLVELPDAETPEEAVKACPELKDKDVVLNAVQDADLDQRIRKWLFVFGEIGSYGLNDEEQQGYLDFFMNLLAKETGFTQAYSIDKLQLDTNLAIAFDYYVLTGGEKRYLMYFSYSD